MKNFFSKKEKSQNPFLDENNNNGDKKDTMTEQTKENTEDIVENKEETIVEESVDETKDEVSDENVSETDKLKHELEDLNNKYLRLAADFDNYRKRQAQERESLLNYGAEQCMKKVLEVVDNFDRAMQSVDKIDDIDKMKESFFILNKQLLDSLTKLGLEQIKAVGETFDPNLHEAVMQTQTEEYPEDTIIKELRKGYKLGEKVLRPAMVDVAVK